MLKVEFSKNSSDSGQNYGRNRVRPAGWVFLGIQPWCDKDLSRDGGGERKEANARSRLLQRQVTGSTSRTQFSVRWQVKGKGEPEVTPRFPWPG